MVGVLVVFAISWLILWLFSRQHITVLGIIPTALRLREFLVGAIIMAVFCAINLLGQAYFQGNAYIRNPEYGFEEAVFGTWWTFKAAIFEELIFRGVILYLLIKRLGIKWGTILSAVAFGIYHWFSYEMFGRGLIPMLYVFLLTGAAGLLFAYAFARSKSLWLPLGLHFGWIFVSIVILSAGPLGDSFYVLKNEATELGGWEQLTFFLWQTLIVPGVLIWYLAKNYNQA